MKTKQASVFQEKTLFWNPSPDVKAKRLKRFTVPIEIQEEMESEK